jgi:hypothetical protein
VKEAWKTSLMPCTAGRQAEMSALTSRTYKTWSHRGGDSDRVQKFDTKIAVLLRDDLAGWQRLNVTAFLVSGIAAANPDIIGAPYEDADGTTYLPMFRQPVLVFEGSKELITAVHGRALGRGMRLAVFTSDLFSTGNDDDNRAAVKAVPRDQLDLVGIAVHGQRNAVDKILKGAELAQ